MRLVCLFEILNANSFNPPIYADFPNNDSSILNGRKLETSHLCLNKKPPVR